MGYNSQKLNNGNISAGACFVTVGSKGVSLTSLVPQGVSSSQNSIIMLQLLSASGATTNKYDYYYGSKKPAFKNYNGWYDSNSTPITSENDVFFAPGEGFWINCAQPGITLQNSGEVLFSDVTRPLNNGNIMIANPYPTEIKLSNMKIGGDIASSQNSIIMLQLLSASGATTNKYDYYYGSKKPAFKNYNGWYDSNSTPITADNDVVFPAGQGFWVNSAQSNLTLTFSLGEEKAAE